MKKRITEYLAYIDALLERDDMDWERERWMLQFARDKAEADVPGAIAIARGIHPEVRGVKGSHLGLILENEQGEIISALGFRAKDKKIYTVTVDHRLEVVDK